jgi:hypothetical protein
MAIGYNALSSCTDGDDNIAIGWNVMIDNDSNTFQNNVALGNYSMDNASNGSATAKKNTAIGNNTMRGQFTDATLDNTAVGFESLTALSSGANNTAVGSQAGAAITTGLRNTVLGYTAGDGFASQNENVFIGSECGGAAEGGDANIAIGYHAIGVGALAGDQNVAIGYASGQQLTSAEHNTFVGGSTGLGHKGGDRNIAIGTFAMDGTGAAHATTGSAATMDSIFIGTYAGSGDWVDANPCNTNVCIGNYAMDDAMNYCTSNVAIGHQALTSLVGGGTAWDGSLNVCIGFQAGADITSGYNNIVIGAGAEPSYVGAVNQIMIGNNCQGIANHYAVIGDDNITRVYAADDVGATLYAGSATVQTSDRRIKEDIKDTSLGLEFVKQLRAVEYKKRQPIDYDESLKKELGWYKRGTSPRVLGEIDKTKSRVGLIAQEVSEVLKDLGFDDNNDIVEIDESNTQQMLAYSKLVPPLVKAIQELSTKVEEQQKEIEELKNA